MRKRTPLGRSTQVVLFTHYDKIVDMARRQAGAAILTMPGVAPERDHSAAVQDVIQAGVAPADTGAARF